LTEEAVSVERTVPESTVKDPPTAVWYDKFVVDTFSELRLIAFTEEVVNVERMVPESTVKDPPTAVW